MTQKQGSAKRIMSAFLALVLLFTMIPLSAFSVSAASVDEGRYADESTIDGWEKLFPISGDISTENAGGVWMDKSVFKDAAKIGSLNISKDGDESFLVSLSSIAANMSITGMSRVPTDSILVLDVSGSMNDGDNDVAKELVDAANESIKALLETNKDNRVGIVLYSGSSSSSSNYTTGAVVLLPLGRYTTGADGEYLNYIFAEEDNGRYGTTTTESISLDSDLRIEGTNTRPEDITKEVVGATYMQRGIITAMEQFVADDNSVTVDGQRRKPVLVLMSDGAPSLGSTLFTDPGYGQSRGYNLGTGSGTSAPLGFVSQLSAAYAKAKIEEKYGTDALFYTIGLGLSSRDDIAIGVMDPTNKDADTALDDFWNDVQTNRFGQVTFKGYNRVAVGEKVSLGTNNLYVTKIETPLEQNYVDKYFEANGSSGDLASELASAFKDVIGAIQLQSGYYPTLVSESDDLSGYVSFVDKIGRYMNVTDIKGIIINDSLFSGADLSSNFVEGGGALGSWDTPSALGIAMVSSVMTRLGIESHEVAMTLIELAYQNGQLRYTNENDFSNYIGWYANKDGKYLGFYNEGTTVLPEPTGNAATDPAFTVRSYGYFGEVNSSNGVNKSDMMYAVVQVRKDIKTGDELVLFAVPASLIPTVTYNVTLDEEGELSELTVTGAKSPIRLVYEVGLNDDINAFNVKDIVSEEYLEDVEHNINADGSVNFYTNRFEHDNKTGYGTVNTYAYFNPSRQNDKYYYLEGTLVCSDANGTPYGGTARPAENTPFYRAYTIYENDGALNTKTVYREISNESKDTAVRHDDGYWYVPKGNVHVNLDGQTVSKKENLSGTLPEVFVPFVDTAGHSTDDLGYEFYVGATLGNNGKITLKPETGIKLTKTMADGVAAPQEAFEFVITNTANANDGTTYPAYLVKADGTETETEIVFANGNATVELFAGDTVYIGGMTAGDTFNIAEKDLAAYIATATGLDNNGEVTVKADEMASVIFVNDERGIGNLTVAKDIKHEYGVDYSIPADKRFTVQVTLSGLGTANAEFDAKHTNGTYDKIKTDANGRFSVELAHDEQFEVIGLPAGTVAAVEEINPGKGFTPSYLVNGVSGNGTVTVIGGATVAVIVTNSYKASQVYPVNVTVGGNKTITGTDWKPEYSFSFRLEKLLSDGNWQPVGDVDTATADSKTFDFNEAFAEEKFASAGIYYYRVVELEPDNSIGGFTYDKMVHSFSVYVGDEDMDGMLEITDIYTNRPDTTIITKTEGVWNVNASFTNTYSVGGTATVTVDVTKLIENIGGSDKSLAGYTFGLFDAATGERVSTLTTTERGFARFVLTYKGEEMNADEETFKYIIKEVYSLPVPAGWEYSTKEIPVTVEIKDVGGTISALIYEGDVKPNNAGSSIAVEFTNKYDPADEELAVDFVSKKLNGRDLVKGEFTFELRNADGSVVLSGTNEADGKVIFDGTLKYDKIGTYFYDIVETSASANGVTVDKSVYRVIVTVTDVNGSLNASYVVASVVGNKITFVNEYKSAPTEHSVQAKKKLQGREPVNDEFTFILTELEIDGAMVQSPKSVTAKNLADGNVIFPAIKYEKAGTYTYTVEERIPAGGKAYGIVYDTVKYKVTLVVEDNKKGSLEVTDEKISLLDGTAADVALFENVYKADSTFYQFIGDKELTGKVDNALVGGEFEFELYRSSASWDRVSLLETVKNSEGGAIKFEKIDFEIAEDQYFIVVEKNGGENIDGVTYDDTVYHVIVEVTDDLKGRLNATVHIYDEQGVPQDGIAFLNVYEVTGGDSVTLSGEKTVDGRDWKEGESFLLELYSADESYTPEQTPLKDLTVDAENKGFEFKLDYTADDVGNVYYYVLSEKNGGERVEGLTFDDTEYRIKVEVKDDNVGGVMTVVTVENATADALDFVNTYAIEEGTYVKFSATKQMEGGELADNKFKFDLIESNEAWESIKVLQTKQNDGAQIVFDRIDYTEEGEYYYIVIEQNAGETVNKIIHDDTYYKIYVKVTDNLDGTLSKTGTVTKVKGDTEESVEELVFVNVVSKIPQTADNSNIALWVLLMLVSCGAVLTLYVCDDKKKENA